MKLPFRQLHTSIVDALGWTFLLEAFINLSIGMAAIEYLARTIYVLLVSGLPNTNYLWNFVIPPALILRCICFSIFVGHGFLCRGSSTLMKMWVIASLIFEALPQMVYFAVILIMSMASSDDHHVQSKLWLLLSLPFLLVFRTYIYVIFWQSQKELKNTDCLHGYGNGFSNLRQYYKNESKRATCILLITTIVWNLWAIGAVELAMEFRFMVNPAKQFLDPSISITSTFLRLIRIMWAALTFCFVTKNQTTCLKYLSFPLQFLLMMVGIIGPFVMLVACGYTIHCSYDQSAAIFIGAEALINLAMDGTLIYLIFLRLKNSSQSQPQIRVQMDATGSHII